MPHISSSATLQELLGLKLPPVAIAFRGAAPANVPHIEASAPAGCGYWRLAAEGKVFYTEAADHYRCPVGAHTHGIDLPPDTAKELEGLVQNMVDLGYITLDEVASLPRREGKFGVAVYAPLEKAPIDADIVLVRGDVRQLMLLAEAAQAAGVAGASPTMGRPTCVVLPEALSSKRTAASFGCIGNRVYTGLGDDEGYYAIPGPKIRDVIEKLSVITEANRRLEIFHRSRATS
jgi:uncharacterized protein (DUF169 family)